MKRVYLILTFFIASFFFVTINRVYAAFFDIEITSDVMSLINDDFKNFRNAVKEHCEINNSYYVIMYNNSNLFALILPTTNDFGFEYSKNPWTVHYYTINYEHYIFENNELVTLGGNNRFTKTKIIDLYMSKPDYFILDSNFELIYNTSPNGNTSYSIDLLYEDSIYSITEGSKFPTIYEIYKEINNLDEPDVNNKFTEEKEMMNNFYSTIFTKISDLATSLVNNYIFLTIFGIFILIFVLELIRRYFL